MRHLAKRTQPSFVSIPSFFDDFFGSETFNASAKTFKPAVNVKEDENAFSIDVLVPGFKKEEVNIKIQDNVLSISAESKEENVNEGETFSRKEFSFKSFQRSFSLPENIDVDNIKAQSENGVLHLSLPKMVIEESNRVKTIVVE